MEQESGSHLDGKLFLSASKYSLYSSMEKNLLLCINTMECIWTKIIYSYFLYELHRILPLGGCGSHYTLMGSIPVNGQILCSCSNYRGSHTNCIFLCFITRHCCLLLQLCFVRQFGSSIQKSDYLALRLGFITNHKLPLSYNFHKYMVRSMEDEFHGIVGISWPLWGYAIVCIFINIHGLNIYFWLSFIPAILVMLVGTKLQHIVSSLALEVEEQKGTSVGNQVKPRDNLFWFGKPEILLRLIQFISFQNAFEMATYIWSLWGFKHHRSCFMKNHMLIIVRLVSGVVVQFWCSYSTVPLNVIITQMGSRCKKALIAESVRESLHSWCKRVKERSKQSHAGTARSVCSLESVIDEREETTTVASGTVSRSSSVASLNQVNLELNGGAQAVSPIPDPNQLEYSFRISKYLSKSSSSSSSESPSNCEDANTADRECETETLFQLFQKT